jgi:hypothetical protein
VPFEIHRGVEYMVGLTLVSLALHQNGSITVLGAGLGVMVPAVITKGRFGLLQWCSTAVHRALDVTLVVLLAMLPLLPQSGGVLVAVFVEPTAGVLLALAVRTEYRAHPSPGAEETRARGRFAPEADVVRPAQPDAQFVDVTARRLGWLAGRLRLSGRAAVARGCDAAQEHRDPDESIPTRPASTTDAPPPVAPGVDRMAVSAGRIAGRIVRAARAAVEKENR